MVKSVALPLPCNECTYNRIINEYGKAGCSANKTMDTCPKLKKFSKIATRIQNAAKNGVFTGYKKQVFGPPVREP